MKYSMVSFSEVTLENISELFIKVLTRAHEREFGSITESNRPIWMLADAAEAGSHDGASHEGIPTDNPAFCTLIRNQLFYHLFVAPFE